MTDEPKDVPASESSDAPVEGKASAETAPESTRSVAGQPPSALPPLSSDAADDTDGDEGEGGAEERDAEEPSTEERSAKEEMADAFSHIKKAASKWAAKGDEALRGASESLDEKFEPALKGVGEKVDAVIDKMDPAIETAAAETKRIASKVAKSAEPMARQVQEGLGRFMGQLSRWASPDSKPDNEDSDAGEEE